MNPLTKTEVLALLSQTAGDLKPYQLEQILDALNRRPYNRGNPSDGFAAQSTMSVVVSGWAN
ncbi:MAG: hypothetical protein ACKV22_09775 [Bryobacteraceae bacterium]